MSMAHFSIASQRKKAADHCKLVIAWIALDTCLGRDTWLGYFTWIPGLVEPLG